MICEFCLFLYVCDLLSIEQEFALLSLDVCVPECAFVVFVCEWPHDHVQKFAFSIHLCVCVKNGNVHKYVCLNVCLSVYLSGCLAVRPSVCLSVCPCVRLSV